MELLLKLVFGAICLLQVVLILVFGIWMPAGAPGRRDTMEMVTLVVSNLAAVGLLGWAIKAGPVDGHWGLAVGLALASVVAFAVLLGGGFLLFANVRWQ